MIDKVLWDDFSKDNIYKLSKEEHCKYASILTEIISDKKNYKVAISIKSPNSEDKSCVIAFEITDDNTIQIIKQHVF